MKKPSKSITTDGVTFKKTPYMVTSTELHAIVNELRAKAGEKEIRYYDFLNRMTDELSDDTSFDNENFVIEKNLDNQRGSKAYPLTEEQALLVGMRESKAVRRSTLKKLKELSEAHNKAFANPPRSNAIAEKRLSHWDMTQSLKDARAEAGKETESKHYMTENKLCNWCITGKFAALDESSLTNEQVVVLKKLRLRNGALIQAGIDYKERKAKLKQYHDYVSSIKLVAC